MKVCVCVCVRSECLKSNFTKFSTFKLKMFFLGLPCKLTGSWVTNKAGVRLDMKVLNKSIIVTLANLIPQPLHEGLLNTTWNVTGHAPFRHGAPFSLLAYDNHTKTLAIFVGK